MVRDTKAEDFCRTVSNFSLEYRTTRQAILLQRERERQKSGAESPGPNTPAARRKHQQTPTEVFFLFQMLIKSILDRMIDLICQPAICWSSRKTRSSSGLRRCWGHLSPHRDWTALCLETAGGWRISKVLNVIHTCLNKNSTCFCYPSLSIKYFILKPHLFTSQVLSHGNWRGDPADVLSKANTVTGLLEQNSLLLLFMTLFLKVTFLLHYVVIIEKMDMCMRFHVRFKS